MSRLSVACPILVLLAVGAWLIAAAPDEKRSPNADWKEVDEAVKKGLPKTAIEKLNPIIEKAITEKDYDEAIRAIGQRIALEGTIQGNKPEEKITRMQAELAKAPAEMKPLMHAILAHWYWQYYQQNRWRFLQRTQTEQAPGEDFTTWALPRLFAEIDKELQAALQDDAKLKATPVSEFDELLVAGTAPDRLRPTMYDFLAHLALAFYSSGEQASVKVQDAFEISAESPIFTPADQFINWKPETNDTESPNYKAIQLYQALLKFHADDKEQSAFRDADLLRLQFGYNKAFGENKNDQYKSALERFADKYAEDEISARAFSLWAAVLQSENDLVLAHKIASRGLKNFPDSVGGKECYNIIQRIEVPSIQATTERVWNKPLPTINVNYRNLNKVWFRVVKADWEKLLESRNGYRGSLDSQQRALLLKQKPELEFSHALPATDDYQAREEEIPAPENLKTGFYYLVSSADEKFTETENMVHFTSFWVSDLALVLRSNRGTAEVGGFVLNAISGDPIANAEVQPYLFHYRTRNQGWKPGKKTKTDENGLFEVQVPKDHYVMLLAKHDQQALSSNNQLYANVYNTNPQPYKQTVFFTDRRLYRPGQTIQYKGLCIDVHPNQDSYKVLPNTTVKVVFFDPNGKEVARQQHRTNDYGSFNGSFTAPRDRLMGQMRIQVDGNPRGNTYFNVEEYKRPKFRVELASPEKPAKLGSEVELKGTATAYTGAAIDGAKVNWRVVREIRYPIWWRYRCWWRPMNSNSQEIAHGTSTTTLNGTFPIEFVATPDLSVSPKDEPTFSYTIYADVTDTTGETRSDSHSIQLGYTALSASLSAADWQTTDDPVKVSVKTTTLDGDGQVAEGTLKIYALKQPDKVYRAKLNGYRPYLPNQKEPEPDPSNINSWKLGDMVEEEKLTTDGAGNATYEAILEAGAYRVFFETKDRFGKEVTAELPVQVLDPDAGKLAIKIPSLFAAPKWTVQPGEEFMALWGTGYDRARAYVEVEHRNKLLQSFWTKPGQTQIQIKEEVNESMRGGFTIRVTMVRENRAYLVSRQISVPWSNKDLTIKWEHFVSKLQPAAKESWTARITGPKAEKVVAEMVAGLYDASLDAYLPHNWMQRFAVFRGDYSRISSQFENTMMSFQHLRGSWKVDYKSVEWTYRSLPQSIISNFYGYQFDAGKNNTGWYAPYSGTYGQYGRNSRRDLAEGLALDAGAVLGDKGPEAKRKLGQQSEKQTKGPPQPDLSQVSARTNLNETAFFFPHLTADESGEVRMEFTMPEALTEWKFMGFAHDKSLRSGYLQDTVVTAKDLMVQPNPPRFVREGDLIEFTVKVSNQSPTRQTGQVRLTLADARTTDSVDMLLGNEVTDQAFDIPSKESRTFSWKMSVPDGMGFLKYTAVGATDRLSDGEEGYLPVLSRRIFVTESLPLPIRGEQTKQFQFEKLLKSGESETLKHQAVTVQMVSNPSWYAVLALPYLMEYPHQCSEQVFNRLYANALARHIANSDPKIRRIFDLWKQEPGDTFDSPLHQNEDLKAVMIEETPWLRQADAESEARRQIGILFDANRLDQETARTIAKLAEMQRADGSWPWFPGGPSNDYITLYITTGFGRMRHLGVQIDTAPAIKSLNRLDGWVTRMYNQIKHKDQNNLSSTIALYLYGRSFFLADQPIDAKHKHAVNYYLQQAREYWLKLANRQSQAHLAIALKRFGDVDIAKGIMASIKERSVTNEELGMFWRDTEASWWWYRAPIETQAMMIEAFDEVMNDASAVEECKVWLLKQKQTQDWKTTKATADAVYALLLRGSNLLASDELVQVTIGEQTVAPEKVEAGTGFYEQTFVRGEVQPKFGQISVKKLDPGVAWGSIHWQYLEDISKITPHDGTPLQLTKQLYVKKNTEKGPVLTKVDGPIAVGDELVVRLVLRTDRSMEYIHLKDQRGSGTEPVNVISRYKSQDGLYYYESTRDTASHFFIDYLPKGVYVFEYSVRVQLRGEYESGMAQIQCMYAPEFNSHSASTSLTVQ